MMSAHKLSYTALVAVMIGLLLAIVPAQAQCRGRRGPNDTEKVLAALLFLATIASDGNSRCGYQPAPPPVWGYNPSYNPGYNNYNYGSGNERGSYSSDWNERTGRWNEYEQVRTPDGGKYSRSTTYDPRWGCETTVSRTEVFRGPYLGHSGPPPP